mgnify:CR=1 FL=1
MNVTSPLASRMSGFVAHLRLNGFALGPRETETALEILADAPDLDARLARQRLKCLLAGRYEEWQRFDAVFEAYWYRRGRERNSSDTPLAGGHGGAARRLWERRFGGNPPERTGEGRHVEGYDPAAPDRPEGRPAASRRSLTARTDLRSLADPGELAEMEMLARQIARSLRIRLSRRWRPRGRKRLDLRRTLRRSLGRGGEPIELVRRNRPARPVRLVILLDASGSMKPSIRVLLQFVKGLVGAAAETEAFLFHTRLVKVSDALRESDPIDAMTRLSLMSAGFGGGTRIAHALRSFSDAHAASCLSSRSAIIVISDGYDTDDPEALAIELARLRRKTRRLLWLNPLAEQQSRGKRAGALEAALSMLDFHGPAGTLADLAALEGELAKL